VTGSPSRACFGPPHRAGNWSMDQRILQSGSSSPFLRFLNARAPDLQVPGPPEVRVDPTPLGGPDATMPIRVLASGTVGLALAQDPRSTRNRGADR